MAKIVGAFATSHILMAPDGTDGRGERVFEGMKTCGQRVREAKPDILLVVSGDHMFNINMAVQIPLCIGVADRWTPFGELGIDRAPFPGHRALAEHIAEQGAARGFDIAKAEELAPDHGITIPLMFADPDKHIPVVPLLVNINMTPLPRPDRCYQLGLALKEAIEGFDSNARVAVIGTGGLSHWLFVPRMGEIAVEFDRMVMREIAAGRAEQLSKLTAAEIVAQSGNGGIEVVTWLMAAATVPGRTGIEIFYEPMPEWLTGMGAMAIPA